MASGRRRAIAGPKLAACPAKSWPDTNRPQPLPGGGLPVERDPDKKAFTRAWSYLSFNPSAKWTALITAAATSVLAVKLLFLLWLFADLVVHRGQVPSYRELPLGDQ